MNVLAVNAGSSSVRLRAYELAKVEPPRSIWNRHIDTSDVPPTQVLEHILATEQPSTFSAVVHRLVHGGKTILLPTLVNPQVKQAIGALIPLAPLHNSVCLAWLEASESVLGREVSQVVVPDTGYFAGLPERARRYALPMKLCQELGLQRFGFHGLAHESMQRIWHETVGPAAPERARLISLQLGAGCSITAAHGASPVDTSMGFTPLEGLVMATRSGDVDPGIIVQLTRREGFRSDDLDHILNHESGLLGLSGLSGDMRRLLASSEPDARLAVEIYCYRARKYIGAYLAALGGADAILFGGGVGEHSPEVRARILERMSWCDVDIDESENNRAISGTCKISREGSRVEVWAIAVEEERLMVEAAYNLISRHHSSPGAGT